MPQAAYGTVYFEPCGQNYGDWFHLTLNLLKHYNALDGSRMLEQCMAFHVNYTQGHPLSCQSYPINVCNKQDLYIRREHLETQSGGMIGTSTKNITTQADSNMYCNTTQAEWEWN